MLTLPVEQYVTRAFPWVPGFRKALMALNAGRLGGSSLFVSSDYSGNHKGSDFLTYAFLVVDAESSRDWVLRRSDVRARFLPDGRRMSFKRLNDASRRSALLPFLNAADHLSGVLVVVIVHKSIARIATGTNTLAVWRLLQGLAGKWTPRAFETMVRIAHFASLFIATFSNPFQHVTWITDEDEIVANEDRLSDVIILTSRMVGLYSNHPLGEFAMNSTRTDSRNRAFEDLVAIPDLVAGTFAEVATSWMRNSDLEQDPVLVALPEYVNRKNRSYCSVVLP